jgi:hypothetical protein
MSRSRSRTQDHDVRLSHWSAVHLALPRRTRNPQARCCVEPSVTRGGAASGTFMDRTHTRAPTRTRIKISARTRDYLDGSPDGAGARPPSATCGGALCLATRNGRILFSFGNWIAVCADHSCREGIRCRMPDFHPPSISEFQPLIMRSRAGHFFALPRRPGQLGPRAENRRRDETISGRIRLPESSSSTSFSELRYTSNGRRPMAASAFACASASRQFTLVYGCLKISPGLPLCATFRGGRRMSTAKQVIPHVESGQWNRN